MKILGIETSCDETAIALIAGEGDRLTVDTSVVFSQIETHEEFGGVVPEVAARLHLEKLLPMLAQHVPANGEGIDAIAVTAGPGLAPALRTGVEVAKTLAWLWGKPLIPVSHIEGHIYANWLGGEGAEGGDENALPQFPALCLIVSGGHTELVLMKGYGEFERIGETIDDAAGEAFDKVAKMLGLGYPGGPKLAKLAEEGKKDAYDFPRALMNKPGFDFSFSGLKTSVMYALRERERVTTPSPSLKRRGTDADIAASFQEAVVDVLVAKTMRAAKEMKPASIILAGGVAANVELRARLIASARALSLPVFVPPFAYAMDNAAMIAAAGYFRAQDGKNVVDPLTLKADPNLEI